MPIEPRRAAEIAKQHGLTLSDARAISAMADDDEEALELAGTFGNGNDTADPSDIADRILRR